MIWGQPPPTSSRPSWRIAGGNTQLLGLFFFFFLNHFFKMMVNGFLRMHSIFIQGSGSVSCSSPSILILLAHQQIKWTVEFSFREKTNHPKLCDLFSHLDVNYHYILWK